MVQIARVERTSEYTNHSLLSRCHNFFMLKPVCGLRSSVKKPQTVQTNKYKLCLLRNSSKHFNVRITKR